jgi:glyceraldehyde 3-phosphate dehydrogenase
VEEINEAFKAPPPSGPLAKVLVYTEDPIVSSDIVGSPASCTFDSKLTMVHRVDGQGVRLVRQRVGLLQPSDRPGAHRRARLKL